MLFPNCPPAPPSTPTPDQTELYFGWFSPAQQSMRVSHPTEHVHNGRAITGPPYTYWTQGDRKVLVTEITHSSLPTPRQIKNDDIYLGPVDKYWGRSYTRLSEVAEKADATKTKTKTKTKGNYN